MLLVLSVEVVGFVGVVGRHLEIGLDGLQDAGWRACVRACVCACEGLSGVYEFEYLCAQRTLKVLGSCAALFALGPVFKPCPIDTGWMYGVWGWWLCVSRPS